tara:strand:- start:861 stop:1058 length:198 start_codon:yes stop_codon:yes gene_type:complete
MATELALISKEEFEKQFEYVVEDIVKDLKTHPAMVQHDLPSTPQVSFRWLIFSELLFEGSFLAFG